MIGPGHRPMNAPAFRITRNWYRLCHLRRRKVAGCCCGIRLTQTPRRLCWPQRCNVQFPMPGELAACEAARLKIRKDCQFHWHNRGYADFDEFLGTFSSRKRKKVRQDRRRVADAGISFRHLQGKELDAATWRVVYQLISITFLRRGSMPYFNLQFFETISATIPEKLLVVLAEQDSKAIAAAIFFVSDSTLYGRYWGSDANLAF